MKLATQVQNNYTEKAILGVRCYTTYPVHAKCTDYLSLAKIENKERCQK